MAVISEIYCLNCKQSRQVSHSASNTPPCICWECQEKIKQTNKENYLAECAAKSVQERLTHLEAVLYDLDRQLNYLRNWTSGDTPIG